tara:strand:+ start:852 stop:1274 length:423 start_codon:yes stop_codon:yes gene_type:complete
MSESENETNKLEGEEVIEVAVTSEKGPDELTDGEVIEIAMEVNNDLSNFHANLEKYELDDMFISNHLRMAYLLGVVDSRPAINSYNQNSLVIMRNIYGDKRKILAEQVIETEKQIAEAKKHLDYLTKYHAKINNMCEYLS